MRLWLKRFLEKVEDHAISFSWAAEKILREADYSEKDFRDDVMMSMRSTQESPLNTDVNEVIESNDELPVELFAPTAA